MAYKKFTQCYNYLPGKNKPFNIKDLVAIVAGAAGPGAIMAIIAWASGAWAIGGFALTLGFVAAIDTVANKWLYQRLVCLSGTKCAVGIVADNPHHGGLGNFDNDEFFNLILMPHRGFPVIQETGLHILPVPILGGPPPANTGGIVTYEDHVKSVQTDGLMGQELLTPTPQSGDLPYNQKDKDGKTDPEADELQSVLHCEAEGEFWVIMKEWAWLMGLVLGAASTAGAAAGIAVAAAICAIPLIGWLSCAIAILVGLLIWAAATAAGAAVVAGIMAIIFEASKGDVEDANVGDKALGPIRSGDRVIVYGEHTYDGFHQGWNEFHPLITVAKLNHEESSQYLQWNPGFLTGMPLPADTDDMPAPIKNLTVSDMRLGMKSEKFALRAKWMREKYCRMMRETHDSGIRDEQAKPQNRWTIHPEVDGCAGPTEQPH